jgi:hypothetical protein
MMDKGNASILATIEFVVVGMACGMELNVEDTKTPTKPLPSPIFNKTTSWK